MSYGAFVRGLTLGPLAQGLKEAGGPAVRCGEAVRRVAQWHAAALVQVETASGSTYTAARVVMATPLGVLKAGSIDFVPKLPEAKTESISRLGCAAMTKVYLRFEEPFWKPAASWWGICGAPSDSPAELFERSFWLPYPFPQGKLPANGAVLCCLLYGERARRAEKMTDAQVQEAAVSALKAAAHLKGTHELFQPAASKKNQTLQPTAIHVTRWCTDEFAGQTWTAYAVDSSPADTERIAEALGDRKQLGFAGEHTVVNEMGTVHGAWVSGLREAERVLLKALTEGRWTPGESMEVALSWLLYCRDVLSTMKALHDEEEDDSSDSESSSSSD